MNLTNILLDAANGGIDVDFQPQNFVANLGYMGKGMIAIFVVIGVIMAATAILNKVFKK